MGWPEKRGSERFTLSFVWRLGLVFKNDRPVAEIADQIERYPERYDVLEKKQAQKTHVPHVPDSVNGDNRARGSYNHSAGYKEHKRCDESAYDTGFGPEIA